MSKKEINRVGEEHLTNNYGPCEIVYYQTCRDVGIRFKLTGYETSVTYSNLIKGKVVDPLRKNVKGVGFIGVGVYSTTTHPKAYSVWQSMLDRCYSDNYETKHQSYVNCFIEEDWHNFQTFVKWFVRYYIDGWDLDKDILGSGFLYSEMNCCFIPKRINRMLRTESGGNLTKSGLYNFRIRCLGGNVARQLFENQGEGKLWYREMKEDLIKKVADQYKNVLDSRVYEALYSWQVN